MTVGVYTDLAVSIDPELYKPELNLNSYHGDLGLDEGVPQNVYVLDTDNLTELNSRSLEAGGITLYVRSPQRRAVY